MRPPSGNRCGHDPASPELGLARETSARMLAFITAAMRAVEVFFHERGARRFPELLACGDRRFKRSERCEAIVRVLKCLLYFMDVVSLRVGLPRPGERCAGITERRIAEWTGLSFSRVQRALADLRAAGFVFSSQPRERRAGGAFVGLAAVRRLGKDLFRRIGLSVRLDLERKKAYRRFQHRREHEHRREASRKPEDPRVRRLVSALGQAVGAAPGSGSAPAAAGGRRGKDWLDLVARLCREHREDPDWTIDRIKAEASRRLL